MIRFVSSNPIFIDPVSQIIFFSVDISTMAYFFINCFEKTKFLKDSSKMGPYLQKKGSTKLMTSSEQGKHLLF